MDLFSFVIGAVIGVIIGIGFSHLGAHFKETRCRHCSSWLTITKKTEMNDWYDDRRQGYKGRRIYFCLREKATHTDYIFRSGPKRETHGKFRRAA